MLRMNSAHSSTCGSEEMERHHLSVVFSVMGLLAIELHHRYIIFNLLLLLTFCFSQFTFSLKNLSKLTRTIRFSGSLLQSPHALQISPFPVLCSLRIQKKFIWMTMLTFIVDSKIVMDIETCVSQHFVSWS